MSEDLVREAGACSVPVRRWRSEAGQATAEYALVLLGAAAVALLLLAWATSTGAIGELFDFVVSQIVGSAA